MTTASTPTNLKGLESQWAVLLTSYRRDGRPVGTAVNIAVEGDHAFMRSSGKAGKIKRIRHNQHVELAPSTASGKVTGPAISARARLLQGEEDKHASGLIAHKYRLVQGLMVPLMHRLLRQHTVHVELRPDNPA